MSTYNMWDLFPTIIDSMREEIFVLKRKLNRTPKWRKVKRLRLLEKINQLEIDLDLLEHVSDC